MPRMNQVRAHRTLPINTTKSQLTNDLIAKVECTDGQAAGALKVLAHESSHVVRAIDTSNEELS